MTGLQRARGGAPHIEDAVDGVRSHAKPRLEAQAHVIHVNATAGLDGVAGREHHRAVIRPSARRLCMGASASHARALEAITLAKLKGHAKRISHRLTKDGVFELARTCGIDGGWGDCV